MLLAALLSAIKAFWSLLVASALIWSGVDLTAIPSGDNATLPGTSDSGEVRVMNEYVGNEGKKTGSTAGRADSSPVVPKRIGNTPGYFRSDAEYSILTGYGNDTEVALADFLADGITGVTFSIVSCDGSRADYYNSAKVENGQLLLESNSIGHVHGTNTESETVCTVTATGEGSSHSQEFSLYTVSDRTPPALPPGSLAITDARSEEIDIQVDMPGSSLGYLRVGWRVAGSQPTFAVVRGVTNDTVLTISGLQPDSSYEIRAYVMTAQAFDLYRSSNTGLTGTLIAEGSPDSKWISNLVGSGLGKSQSSSLTTLPMPAPEPPPTETPETILSPTPRPTPEEEDEDDDLDLDTPTPTDNDGTDTPTLTDNDGTDSDGIDTPTPRTYPRM